MPKNRDPRLDTDPDFICAPKYNNSISKLIDQNPNGVSDFTIRKVLMMSKEDLQRVYQSAMMKLRQSLKGFDDDSEI